MKHILSIIMLLTITVFSFSQTVTILTKGTKTSIRGLSAVNDSVVWVSGSSGMAGKSTDGGTSWKWVTVKGFEKTEFRDIEAFDANNAIIMGIDSPAYILKTSDGGDTWKTVYKNNTKGMFLDAMDFYDAKNGIVIGDPINGKFFLAVTNDGGDTWKDIAYELLPVADSGEACFASSGTNIRLLKKNQHVFISGGLSAHFYNTNRRKILPILQGKESTGANSIAVKNKKMMIAVGGDFNTKDAVIKNCFISTTGGNSWFAPEIPPNGYRSCIEYISGKDWITCGLNGVDISTDNGRTFLGISKEGFHVCRKAKKGSSLFFAGSGGKIAVLKR